jgi:hypothetical protein
MTNPSSSIRKTLLAQFMIKKTNSPISDLAANERILYRKKIIYYEMMHYYTPPI